MHPQSHSIQKVTEARATSQRGAALQRLVIWKPLLSDEFLD